MTPIYADLPMTSQTSGDVLMIKATRKPGYMRALIWPPTCARASGRQTKTRA